MPYDPNKVAFLVLMQGERMASWNVPGREALMVFTSPFTAKRFVQENLTGAYTAKEILAREVQDLIQTLLRQGLTEILIDFRTPQWNGRSHPVTELARYQGLE